MRDPFAWSLPFGRLFGVDIRIHILFPFVALAMILRNSVGDTAQPGAWKDASIVMLFLFTSVLLHEFGHCFGARWVDGEANKVLLWPLGGLANVSVPHTPRANFITTVMGPVVNLVLALLAFLALWLVYDLRPSFNLLGFTARNSTGTIGVHQWGGGMVFLQPYDWEVLLAHLFWVNYVLFLLNVVLMGFPLDGGRMFQCIAWKYVGYQRATLMAIYAGYVTMLIVGLVAVVANLMLPLCLALFIYLSCHQQHQQLLHAGEEGFLGYDFSQGYTSLERDFQEEEEDKPRKKRPGFFARWKQRRQERKHQKEEAQKAADEQRLDELLDKIQRQGRDSLTDEERRFMMRVSDRYRNNR